MNISKGMSSENEGSEISYADFWDWFQNNEKTFFHVVQNGDNIESDFFDKLSPKLEELHEDLFFVTGMYDQATAELILTADGCTKNIVFIEEIVAQAPKIEGWRFTALKPAEDIKDVGINMGGYQFHDANLFFYSNDYPDYPDEIDISIIHDELTEENEEQIIKGAYIFIDNYLGELGCLENIDSIKVISRADAEKELVPIAKLKDFLIWRQKEFVEKYEELRYDTTNDNYSSLTAELNNGLPLFAIVDATLLEWDGKASHPWILEVRIPYDGSQSNGLPDNEAYELLNKFEDELMLKLKDVDGYLNIGRQTADNMREIYFACKDFRKPSKVLHEQTKAYSDQLRVEYDLYKDKYWQSFERFKTN
ncbi:DUF695 domain-containing protein [Sphingobacterium bambusae]|uniref:DUF695 domain-containing protein n=1 Tax=Sphingobacterium bambusae TaxID=662858 RepID=A0ABW6BKC0_9SPHI|nr:DUF695 domain-containing protein [Sphingobacterium bambusae]WPL50973.1 DUF695 domain-containing protein [Sphingobacterium bambusae]